VDVYTLYETLHDKSKILTSSSSQSPFGDASKNRTLKALSTHIYSFDKMETSFTHQSLFQKKILEQHFMYSGKVLKSPKRFNLAKLHMKEAIVCLDEAIRQHGFCRKFSKEDNMYIQLQSLYDM
jgi:hypothetical protein